MNLSWQLELTTFQLYCSVDLFFESTEDRDNWKSLLQALHAKEQGQLGIESMDPDSNAASFEWLILYASIGKVKK